MNCDDSNPYPSGSAMDAEDSSSDSELERTAPSSRRRRKLYVVEDTDSSSDSSVGIVNKRKRITSILSASGESGSSSGSDILLKRHSAAHIPSDNESCSDWSTKSEASNKSEKKPIDDGTSSDASDGQSEKCPICLITFKNQEVGSPESCDHSFCVECIQEWSKNVNTCPIDRQTYNLILVRSNLNGKIVRQIPIEAPNQQNILDDIIEDPTYCEICGSCEREDRMLLCDGCDLGFHLECLTPALNDVPVGVWFCSDCGPEDVNQDMTIYLHEVELLLNDANDMDRPMGPRHRHGGTRLVPRTRQSERVRTNILNHRTQVRHQNREAVPTEPGPSLTRTTTRRTATRTSRPKKRKTRRKVTKRKPRIKITYEIDEETGQEITIETVQRARRRKKKRKRKVNKITFARRAAKPKTVKKRLATQLGMCAPRTVGQSLPDIKITGNNTNIGFQRSQAGIPTLHLFGRREQLDYFSDSENDVEQGGSTNILVRRRPNMSDSALMRRAANRKAVLLPTSSTTTSCDLLGSILNSQTMFHSKNTVLSLGNDGTIKVDSKPNVFNNNNNRVNLNDLSNVRIRQTPMYNNPSSRNNPISNSSNEYRNSLNNVNAVTTSTSANAVATSNSNQEQDSPQDYTIQATCSTHTDENEKKDEKSPNSESELDIYSDIETVSTSKAEESDLKAHSPVNQDLGMCLPSDDDANSDVDLIIDTEKTDEKSGTSTPNNEPDNVEDAVTSTSIIESSSNVSLIKPNDSDAPTSTFVIQSEKVQSSQDDKLEEDHIEDDIDSEDGCPNFSIYSSESMKIAKNTEVALLNPENNENNAAINNEEVPTSSLDIGILKEKDHNIEPTQEDVDLIQLSADDMENRSDTNKKEAPKKKQKIKKKNKKIKDLGLYSDSDDELVKIDLDKPFGISDIRNMTEDISEDERSYTPCLDERGPQREGLEGLEMEAISDEERNDFDESQELKTASDADALEINAKESELDFAKPEDYEEGEIIDKSKGKNDDENVSQEAEEFTEKEIKEKERKESDRGNKESFKKISKSNKDRNYRDKEKEKYRSKSRSKDRNKENERERDRGRKRDRRKERRKEIERYNVRSVVHEKPRRIKDKFGRDIPGRRSNSRSSRSGSPGYRRSGSRGKRSVSRDKTRKRRRRSQPKSNSRSRSRSRKRTRSRTKKRQRSPSRERVRNRRKSKDSKAKTNKKRSVSRQRTRTLSPRRRRDWERRRSKQWSPSASRSPEMQETQSWTPPRVLEKQPVKPHNLTVILTNDSNKKKRDKKKKAEKKKEAAALEKQRKRRRERTPPPSKEVFASGDNILVSVSFNKENDEREATLAQKRSKRDNDLLTKRTRKEKEKRPTKRRRKIYDLSGIKPVAIIDLERSPFKEITPSPKDVIVLSDSDTENTKTQCDSSQQATSPSVNNYSMGPKTPPEPQVKFSLNAKQPQLRAISNPLHEPEDPEIDPQEELEDRLNDTLHKGPNTPPDPPNSAPSSPDAYDPFDPTKSRSPTPEPNQTASNTTQTDDIEIIEIQSTTPQIQTPDALKSHTPPVTDIQPADSQSNSMMSAADAKKTPEALQTSIFPTINKPVAQTIASSAPLLTFTAPRINILNSTILNQPASSVPQRIVLPNTMKSSLNKVQSSKAPIKSTPIKPMPNKSITKNKRKNRSKDSHDIVLEFDSPYSPGSSDYEDLFDPPSEPILKIKQKTKRAGKNNFDTLFGSSPKSNRKGKLYPKKKGTTGKGTKMVGVIIDEDSLKIMDDVPNSAVEMQVKDKFLKKLNRQERVVEEVKLVLKPHYNKKHVTKEEYKDILRRAVPKICHNKSGEINPKKIQNLIEAYVKKCRQSKKVTSSSSVNK